nr:MAG TPA: hypothetical protein [Caudoviricetes sp.]
MYFFYFTKPLRSIHIVFPTSSLFVQRIRFSVSCKYCFNDFQSINFSSCMKIIT